MPQHIGLFIDAKNRLQLSEEVTKWFDQRGVETTLLNRKSEPRDDLDLVVVMGGDGSVLFALRQFSGCPVIGVNYGHIGFLTAGNREDLYTILKRVIAKDYVLSERFMLECVYPSGTAQVVNEVVVKGATRLITVDFFVNETPIRKIRGDGVVVGTPTGSTAYLLSAGSPIVMPGVQCMILAGLNEYNFTARQLVVNHDSELRLVINEMTREQDIYLSVDGDDKIALNVGDELLIRESQQTAKLLFLEDDFFFNNLSSRLSW